MFDLWLVESADVKLVDNESQLYYGLPFTTAENTQGGMKMFAQGYTQLVSGSSGNGPQAI
jgi:hypothetical protein